MRISDWSSDVCSSDLGRSFFVPDYLNLPQGDPMKKFLKLLKAALEAKKLSATVVGILLAQDQHEAEAKMLSEDAEGKFDKLRTHFEVELGRASCRESVCQSV